MTDKRTLGIGVISLGWMGRLHARSYRAIVERFPELGVAPRLIAAADPVDRVRQEAVDNLGFERACADYHDLLADPEVEAVSICAPNFLHHEMALAAVEAGKPFWIDYSRAEEKMQRLLRKMTAINCILSQATRLNNC